MKAIAILLLTATALRADVVLTLTPSVRYGARSNEVVYTGTLSNTNLTGNVFLNNIQINFTGIATNYLTGNSNTFFANVPGILLPGETYSDTIFAVAINSTTPATDYFGTVTITGGTNIVDGTPLGSQAFQIAAADTPFGAWQLQEFGGDAGNPTISGDSADPDGDSTGNLLEYAFQLNPNVAGSTDLPVGDGDPACDCLTLTYLTAQAATDLRYTVEGAATPAGPWSTNGITSAIIDADTLTLTIRASDAGNPFSTTGKRFLHLKVTRTP